MSTITHESVLVAVANIKDPAAREQARRRINRLNIMPFKITDTIVKTDRNHTGTSAWTAAKLESVAPLLKSGARKGWPKGSLSAEIIEALDTLPRIESFRPVDEKPAKKVRTRARRRTAVKETTGMHAADAALASGEMVWADDGALVPA